MHPATLPQPETTQGLLMPPLKEPPEPNEQSLLSSKTLLYPDVKSRLSFERYVALSVIIDCSLEMKIKTGRDSL